MAGSECSHTSASRGWAPALKVGVLRLRFSTLTTGRVYHYVSRRYHARMIVVDVTVYTTTAVDTVYCRAIATPLAIKSVDVCVCASVFAHWTITPPPRCRFAVMKNVGHQSCIRHSYNAVQFILHDCGKLTTTHAVI